MKFHNTLVLAAHPDDEVLGVGATIPLLRRAGGRVTVVIVTDGTSAQYEGDEAARQRKQAQAVEANRRLGVDRLLHWDFPDMRLDRVEHVDLNRALESLLHEEPFDAVFVQNGDDVNLDHHALYRSALVATRPAPGQTVQALFAYPVNSSTEWGGRTQGTIFCPNYFVDVTETIDQKLHAMAAYEDELREAPHPRSLDAIRQRAAVSGHEVGRHYAEAFKLLLYHGTPSEGG